MAPRGLRERARQLLALSQKSQVQGRRDASRPLLTSLSLLSFSLFPFYPFLCLSHKHTHTHTTHSLPSASLELSIKRGSNGRRRTLTQPFPSLSHRLEYIIIDVGPVAPTTSHVSSIRARFSDRPSLFRSASKRWQGAGTRLSVLLVFISL